METEILYLDGYEILVEPEPEPTEKEPIDTIDTIDYTALTRRIAIESALLAAHNAMEAYNTARADDGADVDELALERQARNAVLAGNGEKALLLGDLSNPPTYDKVSLEAAGFEPAMAEAIAVDAARIRAAAVALDGLLRAVRP